MSTILITGGSGFLGRRLGLYFRERGHHTILASRNHKQLAEAATFSGCPTIALDVARLESVRDVFVETMPEIVIHAAATKFVDLADLRPMEAVDINVAGSQNVARVAIDCGVETVIGISTDKAAPPVKNVYGLSKALMERIYCALDGKAPTRFLCVRYGNVAWSTGSVLPIWQSAAARGEPLRSTGPEMLRFFFTVDEAVGLVATALENAGELGGVVLARAMRAARMGDILQVWRERAGIQVEPVPAKPGERTVEYLIGEQELAYTSARWIGDIQHYMINFSCLAEQPVAAALSSENAVRLGAEELWWLINHPPAG